MGKGPTNGGIIANRGFIFQTIVAEIQCLKRNDWNSIKVEPETKLDKVDIMLYQDEKILSAIQVKSSKNPFERSDVKKWLEKLRADAAEAEEICLYLVGEQCKPACEDFIAEHSSEIKKNSFESLPIACAEKLVEYIRSAGNDEEVRVDDLEFMEDALFAKLFKNSIAKEPISRAAFEERFQKALPVYIIPKCLTPIPTINHEVGLVGRDDIKKFVREMLEANDRTALVSGLGGIGKTAVMQHVCNDLKNEGNYVAWIECGESFKEDLLLLRTALGIPESDNADVAYEKIIKELRANKQLVKKLYIFLDNLSRILGDDEQEELNGLGIHVMVTSRFEHDYFVNLPLDVLTEQSAMDMFYGYYLEKQKDKTRRYEDAALEIIRSVQSHTLLTELLAKAAWKKGGTLEAFRDALKAEGVFDVFQRKLSTKHDKNRTIAECVMELYK
ncbi:MAG: ATP-binding protein, partial [Clostridia bacterium]|nr:ATP-binding protein [Clostridia bacterium]